MFASIYFLLVVPVSTGVLNHSCYAPDYFVLIEIKLIRLSN